MAQAQTADLRNAIANTLRNVKAYDLPGICERFGLAAGDKDEAFASKYTYVHRRLMVLDRAELQRVAAKVVEEFEAPELEKCLEAVTLQSGPTVTPLIRERILEALQYVSLQGRANNIIDMLASVFPLARMPPAYPNARQPERSMQDDVWQHCINNDDWDNRELLSKLGVMSCPQAKFFQLLERLVDPTIREEEDQSRLVETLNAYLQRDGYELAVTARISGYPVYSVRRSGEGGHTPADAEISNLFRQHGAGGIDELWDEALKRRTASPAGAITLARTLLEGTCRYILDDLGVAHAKTDDLPKLWGSAAEALKLAPNQHTELAFRKVLGGCQTIVGTLSNLRNELGDAHGKGRPVRPQARHAELAVNLAGSMAKFLLATWEHCKSAKGPSE